FLQGIWRLGDELSNAIRTLGIRFVEVSNYVQALVGAWASRHPEPSRPGFVRMPAFPSLLADSHLDMEKRLTPEQTLELMQLRVGQAEQIAAELVLRMLLEYGPVAGPELLQAAGFARWNLPFDRDQSIVR